MFIRSRYRTSRPGNSILGEETRIVYGAECMRDQLLGCEFDISPTAFYQTNPQQTCLLYTSADRHAFGHDLGAILQTVEQHRNLRLIHGGDDSLAGLLVAVDAHGLSLIHIFLK